MGIGGARARSRITQLVAIAATATVLAGIGVAMVGVLESGLDAAVRAAATEPAAQLLVEGERASAIEPSVREAFGATPVTVDDGRGSAVVAPDPDLVGAGDLTALRDGADHLADVLVENGVASRTAVSGNLSAWAQELLELSWRSRLLAVMPLLVLVAVAAVAARDVVRVLATSRIAEYAVTRSRGASRARLLGENVREILVAGIAGALAGGILAGLVTGAPVGAVLAALLVVPLLLGAVGVRVVGSAIPGDRADEAASVSGRSRAVGVVGLGLLGVATALAFARLIPTASAADPVGIAAPALGILSSSVLVLVAVSAVARIADRLTPRWRALGPALAVRRVARRLRVFATVVLLIAIAAATTVLAAAFGATGDRVAEETRQLRVGGDLLVADWPADDDPDGLPAEGVAPLLTNPGQLGDDEPLILASGADRLAVALRPLDGLVDPEGLGATIATPIDGLPLPDGTSALDLEVEASDGVTLRVWVLELNGRVRVAAVDEPIIGPASALLAIDADVSRAAGAISVRLTSLVATTPSGAQSVPLPTTWEPQFEAFPDFQFGRFAMTTDVLGFELGRRSSADVDVRLMAPGAAFTRIPAVVTADLAARNGLAPGADLDVRFAGTGRTVLGTVATTPVALPIAGDRDALLVDYPAFAVQQLRVAESVPPASALVLSAADATALREGLPRTAEVVGLEPATPDLMLGIARSLLWVAAAGSIAVAVVGVASVSSALLAERRRETRILAVLGETAVRQSAAQRAELGIAMGLALLGGTAAGALLSIVAVPAFARAAAPGSGVLPDVPLTLDLGGGGVLLAGFVLLLGAVVLGHGRRVRRDADRPIGGRS